MRANALVAAVALAASTLTSCRSLTVGETRFLSTYYWLNHGATRPVDLAPVRITCLTPTGTHDPSKILQSHGAKAINGLTLRSRDDVDTISDEGAEASLGDADAITIGNTIMFIGRFCRSDFASEYPVNPKPIEQSVLAHEVMHVWQQQHASPTGYSLMRTISAISEHVQYGSEVYRYGPLALKRAFSLTG